MENLTREEELADIFADALRVAGSPEAAKSAFRAYILGKAIELPPLVHSDDPHQFIQPSSRSRLTAPPSGSSVSTVSTVSTGLTFATKPPKRRTTHVIPTTTEDGDPPFNDSSVDTLSEPFEFHLNLDNNGPNTSTPRYVTPVCTFPRYTVPQYDHTEDVHLSNPTIGRIDESESSHEPAMFHYIRFMISHDRLYMGEAKLGHYRFSSGAFSPTPLSLPGNHNVYSPDGWYAVSSGRALGIYMTWSECKDLVDGCPRNCYKNYKDYHDAVVFMQAALLRRSLTVVPRF